MRFGSKQWTLPQWPSNRLSGLLSIDNSEPLSRSKSYHIALYLLVAYWLIATFPGDYLEIASGIDPSWRYALNYLTGSDVAFGRDVAFTYGPLGFVLALVPVESSLLYALLIRLVLHLLLGALLLIFMLKAKDRLVIFAFFVCFPVSQIIGFSRYTRYYECHLIVLLCMLLSLALKEEKWRVAAFPLSSVLAGFLLFAKFSMGMSAGLSLAAGGLLLIIKDRNSWKIVILSGLVYLIAVAMMSSFLLDSAGNFVQWMKASLEFVDGYGEAQSRAGSLFVLIACFVALAIYAVLTTLFLIRKSSLGMMALAFTIPVFMSFKGGFVRQDAHVLLFFFFMPALMCVFILNADNRRDLILSISGFMLFLVLGIPAFDDTNIIREWPREAASTITLKKSWNNLNHIINHKTIQANALSAKMENRKLPEEWLGIIDVNKDAVDVIPWEISYCPANDLKWTPTPTLQTFMAHTSWLDSWNAEHFINNRVPDYVIAHYDNLDNRHLLWDTPASWRAIISNFEIVRSDLPRKLLLLKRKAQLVEPQLHVISEEEKDIDEWIDVPDSTSPLYVEIDMSASLMGKLRKTLFRLPCVNIDLSYESGREASYRIAPDVIKNGVLINYLPASASELENLFNRQVGDPIRHFRISGPGAAHFNKMIRLTWKTASTPL